MWTARFGLSTRRSLSIPSGHGSATRLLISPHGGVRRRATYRHLLRPALLHSGGTASPGHRLPVVTLDLKLLAKGKGTSASYASSSSDAEVWVDVDASGLTSRRSLQLEVYYSRNIQNRPTRRVCSGVSMTKGLRWATL